MPDSFASSVKKGGRRERVIGHLSYSHHFAVLRRLRICRGSAGRRAIGCATWFQQVILPAAALAAAQ